MDMAVCKINSSKTEIEFSGAQSDLIFVRDNNIKRIKGDRYPIGSYLTSEKPSFTTSLISLKKGDQFSIFHQTGFKIRLAAKTIKD